MPPPTPRERPTDYSNERDFNRDFNANIMILKRGCGVQIRKPSWKGTETIVRFLPCLKYENPAEEFEPYRIDPGGKNVLSDWIRRYDVAWKIGNPDCTFLLRPPDVDPDLFNVNDTPLAVLYRAVENACTARTAPQHWWPLIAKIRGQTETLSRPASVYLTQALILKINSKPTFGGADNRAAIGWPPNPPCVFMLTGATGQRLDRQLAAEREDYRGDPANFEARYVHGDVVSPDYGRFVHFFQSGFDPRQSQGTPQGGDPYGGAAGAAGGDDRIGYDFYVSADGGSLAQGGRALSAKMNRPEQLDKIRQQWRWWEDILHFRTYAEQVALLCERFPLDLCRYAFRDRPGWLPEDFEARWQQATAVSTSSGTTATAAPATTPAPSGDPFGAAPSTYAGPPATASPNNPFAQRGSGAPWSQQSEPAAAPATVPASAPALPASTDPFGGSARVDPLVPAGEVPAGGRPSADQFGTVPPASPSPEAAPAPARSPSELAKLAAARATSRT